MRTAALAVVGFLLGRGASGHRVLISLHSRSLLAVFDGPIITDKWPCKRSRNGQVLVRKWAEKTACKAAGTTPNAVFTTAINDFMKKHKSAEE